MSPTAWRTSNESAHSGIPGQPVLKHQFHFLFKTVDSDSFVGSSINNPLRIQNADSAFPTKNTIRKPESNLSASG